MKEVYLLRHAEKDASANLTERGKQAARAMRMVLPEFARVTSSGFDRAIMTANLLTGVDPAVDQRAAYAETSAAVSSEIDALAREHGVSFLDAARLHNDPEVLSGIEERAHMLNEMIDQLLGELVEGEHALIVSHDITIVPAMSFRDMSSESIDPLGGYIISMNGGTSSVRPY